MTNIALTHPELEEAIKHVTSFDDCQVGMLEYSKLWRLVVAARQYIWMLKNGESLSRALARLARVLEEIRDLHLGDCPASANEVDFARAHIARMRRIASDALNDRSARSRDDEIEDILAMTDEQCLRAGIAEYGSEEAWRDAMEKLRDRMLKAAAVIKTEDLAEVAEQGRPSSAGNPKARREG